MNPKNRARLASRVGDAANAALAARGFATAIVERWYRTHWVSRALAEEKRKREAEKARRVPPPRQPPEVEDWDVVAFIEREYVGEQEDGAPPPQPRRPTEADEWDIPF